MTLDLAEVYENESKGLLIQCLLKTTREPMIISYRCNHLKSRGCSNTHSTLHNKESNASLKLFWVSIWHSKLSLLLKDNFLSFIHIL